MAEPSAPRPGPGRWLFFLLLAGWLALLPLVITSALQALNNSSPYALVQLELVPLGDPLLPARTLGLLSTVLTLGLNLLVLLPLLLATRKREDQFPHTVTILGVAIALAQALNGLAALACQPQAEGPSLPASTGCLATAALRLALVLPLLLLGLGWVEARRQEGSLLRAWRRVGLRLWLNPSALWLGLAAGAVIVWPWVVVGSLGSPGTTMGNLLQALPTALNEEILFRGFAFAWLWRAARNRRAAAIASLLLFVAAQGGTTLPYGDWDALLRFGSALLLGLLTVELTIRAGGSVWPAVVVHLLYNWFSLAFVDPRSVEQVLHWVARIWAPLTAGGLGLLLWLGRKASERTAPSPTPSQVVRRRAAGTIAPLLLACLLWAGTITLYLAAGVPGFHPDGFLIFLEEQADLSPAQAMTDPLERRAWVYQTLVETAERSQAPLRAELQRRGANFRPHYLVNMIEVRGRPELRRAFAEQQGVASVLFHPGVRRYAFPFRIPDVDITGAQGVEWNVQQVGADRVWSLGVTGQGVVVGGADTGVAWDHPALKQAYLGWDGQIADHDYHWYDPWDGRAEPWDDSGHGTHTTGTVLGRDGENQVGLAPGAQWIACRNMRQGLGNPGSYVSCMEFLLAPFPLGGDPLHDGDPARGAHIVNNSWGCPTQEGCQPDTLHTAVENLSAAGQMMVVSAGNEGPACGTVEDPPALYDAALSVGALGRDNQVAGFSSRGPVVVGDSMSLIKPDLVAPGVDIRSAIPGGYAALPGTSMAGPHVAGAVALLWSADPALIGDIDRTEALLTGTAQRLTADAVCAGSAPGVDAGIVCACGDDVPGSVPNNVYGWGMLDVWAAVQMLLEGQ
jgi:subtilisin family serine protease/membrane protease YdiL (CAAX protease family)